MGGHRPVNLDSGNTQNCDLTLLLHPSLSNEAWCIIVTQVYVTDQTSYLMVCVVNLHHFRLLQYRWFSNFINCWMSQAVHCMLSLDSRLLVVQSRSHVSAVSGKPSSDCFCVSQLVCWSLSVWMANKHRYLWCHHPLIFLFTHTLSLGLPAVNCCQCVLYRCISTQDLLST